MKQSFLSLSFPKQLLVILVTTIILLLLLYSLVLLPLQQKRDNAENAVQKQAELLQWMQQQKQSIDQLKVAPTADYLGEGQSISAQINESAQEYNIDINRFQSLDQKHVQIWLESSEFSKLLLWLQTLHSSYGIFVDNITISETASASSGYVSVSMMLSTPF